MVKVASGKDPPNYEESKISSSCLHKQDNDDIVVDVESDMLTCSTVKMKLNTFCTNQDLSRKLQSLVLDMNQLVGEAYSFANLHIVNLLNKPLVKASINIKNETCVLNIMYLEDIVLPTIDRNFYYSCLAAVSTNNAKAKTLEPVKDTIPIFESLRDNSIPKINIVGQDQIMANLSISMATMANNHLWMNIGKRIKRFIKWNYPSLKSANHKQILESLLYKPNINIDSLFSADSKGQLALMVAKKLKPHICLPSGSQSAKRSNLLLPLYFHMLKKTEEAIENARFFPKQKKKYKTFTLLPLKHGYTISYLQFSARALMDILKKMGLENYKGDSRYQDPSIILKKYFNNNLVETRNRKFAHTISTDGKSVSILMKLQSCLICPNKQCPCQEKLQEFLERSKLPKTDKNHVRLASVDPGITDIGTIMDQFGEISSYSSARYYETALYNVSRRRINQLNEETKELTASISSAQTCNLEKYKVFVQSYLKSLRPVLNQRNAKGYRNLRFLRWQRKKLAIKEICDLIAPPGEQVTVVAFGDWIGINGTPISRRCAGPLQEIKFELQSRANVVFISIDEYCTSRKCSNCYNDLTNMKASTTVYKNVDGKKTKTVVVKKIHKVLHCKNNQANASKKKQCCGATWDRDVNAAKNILTLTLCLLENKPRPPALQRKTNNKKLK